MAFGDKLVAIRRAHNLTQEGRAAKLYVTRQAVSRWERGEVTPGIDMMKLIGAVTGEPLSHLLEMPEHYCESCGMYLTPDDLGTDANGKKNDHYCKWCYDHGEYTYDTTMGAMIEDCAPRLAENEGITLDEAVSLMGAVLPQLVGSRRHRASVLCPPGVRAADVYGLAARRYGLHCSYPDAPVQALLGCVQPEKACSEQVLRSIIELELARGNDSVVLDSAQLCAAFAHFGLAARYPQAADGMELLAQAALLQSAAATGVRRA